MLEASTVRTYIRTYVKRARKRASKFEASGSVYSAHGGCCWLKYVYVREQREKIESEKCIMHTLPWRLPIANDG